MKAILLLITSSFLCAGLIAQDFSKEETVQDLTWLKERIIEFNAGLDIFTPDFSQKADSLIKTVNGDSDKFAHFRKVCELAALSNEGHYSLGQSSDSVHYDLYNDRVPFFPTSVEVIGDQLFVNYDLTNEGELGRGAELISINGKTAKAVIAELIKCIPTDGKIETYPRRRVSENFPWLYYFTMEQPEVFEVEFLPKESSEVKNISLTALTASVRVDNFKSRYVSSKSEPSISDFYTLEYLDDVAWLTLKSFDWRLIEKYDLDAKDFYQELFSGITENSPHTLVVDLRGNTGGRNEFADEMIPFIRRGEIDYLSKSVSWKGKTKTNKARKRDDHAFEGKVYVLIDGLTYSNGAVLARYLKEYADATIVGEEGGTRYEGFTAGSYEYVTLPNSALRIGIPNYAKVFPKSKIRNPQNRGLMPDVGRTVSIDEMLSEEDEIKTFVLNLIHEAGD